MIIFTTLYPMGADSANTTLQKILLTQLAALAIAAGGGTSGGAILMGAGNPNGSVASTASPQLYYQTTGALWLNDGAIGTTTWSQLI